MRKLATMAAVVAALGIVSTALAAGGLSGTFRTKLSGGQLAGTWIVAFKSGKYLAKDNGNPVVHGKYKISGTKIAFTDTGGPGKCPGTGRYTFKLKGRTLTFTKISDPKPGCAGRVAVLTKHPLKKVD